MSKKLWLRASVIAAIVLVADQVTKSIAERSLVDGPVHLFGPLRLTLVFNPGIAFGIGSGIAPYLVIGAILVIVVVMIKQRSILGQAAIMAIGLVLGGALGNLVDRMFRGHGGAVVDFIDIGPWPVFNLADTAVVIGAFVLAIAGARKESSPSEETTG